MPFFSVFPSCANSELQKLVEVDQHESVQLKCHYHSSSASYGSLSFGWSMNSTKDSVDFPKSDFTVDGEKSILTFSAKTDMDFGTVTCNAADQVGPTNNPCTFQIVPKGSLLHLSIYQSILTYFLKGCCSTFSSSPSFALYVWSLLLQNFCNKLLIETKVVATSTFLQIDYFFVFLIKNLL